MNSVRRSDKGSGRTTITRCVGAVLLHVVQCIAIIAVPYIVLWAAMEILMPL